MINQTEHYCSRSSDECHASSCDVKHSFRIAIGSCNNQNLTQPLWDVLTERHPAVFVWAGDAIYADRLLGLDWSTFPPKTVRSHATPSSLAHYYSIQARHSGYHSFLNSTNVTLMGTVDDHDFGVNNGDSTYEYKRESGEAFLNFIGEAKSSIMYKRASTGRGVYGVKVFDFNRDEGDYLVSDEEAGIDPDIVGYHSNKSTNKNEIMNHLSNKSVAVFVLDVRTNKTPWAEGFKGWRPNYEGDFLGEDQWKWFETTIRNSKASVNLVVNGLQVHPYRIPDAKAHEVWAQFPTARQRLYDAILQEGVQAPILVSGDVHMSQLMRKDCVKHGADENSFVKPLVEFTTSGMTHSFGTCFASNEKFHQTWRYYYMHVISKTIMSLCHLVLPMPELMISTKEDRWKKKAKNFPLLFENGGGEINTKRGKQYTLELNFGEFEFNWEKQTVTARAFGKGLGRPPLLSAKWSLAQLSGQEKMPGRTAPLVMTEKYGRFWMDGELIDGGKYVCMNHRAPAHLIHFVLGYSFLICFILSIGLSPLFLCGTVLHRWKKKRSIR